VFDMFGVINIYLFFLLLYFLICLIHQLKKTLWARNVLLFQFFMN